jgi:hypothetical protein
MAEIVEGLDGAKRDRIGALRKAGRFFWIDVPLSETRPDDLAEVLGIPKDALQALLAFGGDRPSSRKFYADGEQVVFAFSCYSSRPSSQAGPPLTACARSRSMCWSAGTTC